MNNTSQLLKQRREKLEKIKALGISPYPTKSHRTHNIIVIRENEETMIESKEIVAIAGRLKAMRRQGKVGFGNIEDETGRIQIFVRKDTVGEENYDLFKLLDMGDFVQVEGEVFRTKMGELSVRAHKVTILGKNLRPIPTVKEKEIDGKTIRFDEFSDIETRYRKRYLDLLLNPDNKETFVQRGKIISAMRRFLESKGFIEVETPSLQPLYGGANARPFVTHHNALDFDLYLRIATELYLKRLIVGGFEKVFEIGKNFRNEGMDKTHNPEFTAMELYQAYTDINGMMDITEDMIVYIANEVFGKTTFEHNGHSVSLAQPWRRIPMTELVKEHTGFDCADFDLEKIRTFCESKGIEVDQHAGAGKLITELFDAFVEPNLIQPTFVIDYPKEVSPLAKAKPGSDNLVERFELFMVGAEYGNAFTELNDAIDQRNRLEAQAKLRELGDVEANVVDEDFLQALEFGMPPTGGLGIGVDRLIMFFTGNTSIKDVLLFPTMKPQE